MKNTKNFLSRSVALAIALCLSIQLFAMEPFQLRSNQPLLQVYFSPEDQVNIKKTLFTLLDNAKKQIFIAMYWVTDNAIIEKIIAAKLRNVDVQFIVDESSLDYMDIVPQLLDNGIAPIINPSGNIDTSRKMHHKFLVVDGMTVFTGSANFTKTVLNSKTRGFNFENVIVINSIDIASQFGHAFARMEKEIFDLYVDIIASKVLDTLPVWMSRVVPTLYQMQPLMQQAVNQPIKSYTVEEQERINSFFSVQPTEMREDRITDPQKKMLNMNGFTNREIVGLSKKEASELINKVKSSGWMRTTQEQRSILRNRGYSGTRILLLSAQEAAQLINASPVTARQEEPVQPMEIMQKSPTQSSEKQEEPVQFMEVIQKNPTQFTERRDLLTSQQQWRLKKEGFSDEEISGLSKQEASQLIGNIAKGWEPATVKQRSLLRDKGFSNEEVLGLSKQEAFNLIGQVLSRGVPRY